MSFDKEGPDQMVDPKKRSTKVNMGVVLGVLAFFVLGTFAMCAVGSGGRAPWDQASAGSSASATSHPVG